MNNHNSRRETRNLESAISSGKDDITASVAPENTPSLAVPMKMMVTMQTAAAQLPVVVRCGRTSCSNTALEQSAQQLIRAVASGALSLGSTMHYVPADARTVDVPTMIIADLRRLYARDGDHMRLASHLVHKNGNAVVAAGVTYDDVLRAQLDDLDDVFDALGF